VGALLRYWELQSRGWLTCLPLLKDVGAAVRLRDLFAVLHALGRSAVRHQDYISASISNLYASACTSHSAHPTTTYVWFLTFAHLIRASVGQTAAANYMEIENTILLGPELVHPGRPQGDRAVGAIVKVYGSSHAKRRTAHRDVEEL
jgi:hypothetical protein